MADTELGAELTRAHKETQTRLGLATMRDLLRVWPTLDPGRLDETWAGWYQAVAEIVRSRHQASARLAARYLTAFKAAETGVLSEPILVGLIPPQQLQVSARVTGPIAIKKLTAAGLNPVDAAKRAFVLHSGSGSRLALQGGRDTINMGIDSDPDALGYRRVTSSNPCAFCKMLAGRGAVYKQDTAIRTAAGRKYHDHCNCVSEPVYTR